MAEELGSIELSRYYLKNALGTDLLQAELLKGFELGEPLHELLLKAMKALAICEEDESLVPRTAAGLRSHYGIDPEHVRSEEEVALRLKENLAALTALQAVVTDDESARRLNVAVAIQRKRLKSAEAAMGISTEEA